LLLFFSPDIDNDTLINKNRVQPEADGMKKKINSTFHYYVNWLLKELGEKCEHCFLGVIASTDTTIIYQ